MSDRPNWILQTTKDMYVYNPETGELFVRVKTYTTDVTKGKYIASNLKIRGYNIKVTHAIYALMNDAWPDKDMCIDHKDRDVTNTKWNNLRLATRAQNNMNKVTIKTNGLEVGVRKQKNGYVVQISDVYLGYYTTIKEANNVARRYRAVLHGKFAFDATKFWRRI